MNKIIDDVKLKASDSLNVLFNKINKFEFQLSNKEEKFINDLKKDLKNGSLTKDDYKKNKDEFQKLLKETYIDFRLKVSKVFTEINSQKPTLEIYKPKKFSNVDQEAFYKCDFKIDHLNNDLKIKCKNYSVLNKKFDNSFEQKLSYQILSEFRMIVLNKTSEVKFGFIDKGLKEAEKLFKISPGYKDYWEQDKSGLKKLNNDANKLVSKIDTIEMIKEYALPILKQYLKNDFEDYKIQVGNLYKNEPEKYLSKINEREKFLKECNIGVEKLIPAMLDCDKLEKRKISLIKFNALDRDLNQINSSIDKIKTEIAHIGFRISPKTENLINDFHNSFIRISEFQSNLHEKEPENYRTQYLKINKDEYLVSNPNNSEYKQKEVKSEMRKQAAKEMEMDI